MNQSVPFIPETITVHLGAPDEAAENITLPFLDYIANVASSEIYPTWPDSALRANIYAQISFALNRIYTEYYPSRGYDFDITNSTSIDQSFVNQRNIFDNIYSIVTELFDDYISRQGNVEPLFASYCDGIKVTCNGLSQWGSVALAEQGYTPYEILTYYFGNNIDIVTDTPIAVTTASAPEFALRPGTVSDDVRLVQLRLNRVSNNYPSIPKIPIPDGIFADNTENAVRAFQRAFNLTEDGIVGDETWYTLQRVYFAVKKLNDLASEGISVQEVTQQFPDFLTVGDTGVGVRNLQYYLNYISAYFDSVPPVTVDGIFGDATRAAVIDFQTTFGLTPDGLVGEETWDTLYRTYIGIIEEVPIEYTEGVTVPFPGVPLRVGSQSDAVRVLQEYINYISRYDSSIPSVSVTGYFGSATEQSVLALQRYFGITANGVVDAGTWNLITGLYTDLYSANVLNEGQYPGYEIG